ncbi:MAG: nucleotidyltransferase [Chloroflexi bacterium]|nr:nucleotidyltransferase [Chloroflexota bacterium]
MNYSELLKHRDDLKRIAAKYKIREIYVIGSVARDQTSSSSDIDFLIELAEGASALGVGGFSYEAEKLLGISVDVIPSFALPGISDGQFKANIEDDAIAL